MGGLGVDRCYMGYALTGMLKMTVGLTVLILTTLRVLYSFLVDTRKLQPSFKRMWMSYVFFVFACSMLQFILWIVDVGIILSDSITDSNGCILSH